MYPALSGERLQAEEPRLGGQRHMAEELPGRLTGFTLVTRTMMIFLKKRKRWCCFGECSLCFSLRRLQEKCREQQMPLYIAFISPMCLIWSAETASVRFSQISVAHPNCRARSSLSTPIRREQYCSMAAPSLTGAYTTASNHVVIRWNGLIIFILFLLYIIRFTQF